MQSRTPPTTPATSEDVIAASGAPTNMRTRPPRTAFPHKAVPGGGGGGEKAPNPMWPTAHPPATNPPAADHLARSHDCSAHGAIMVVLLSSRRFEGSAYSLATSLSSASSLVNSYMSCR